MLWRLTLAVAVVCVGGICSCVKADVMSRLIVPRDYGVKLCGREFIRAVIFTCGGSRGSDPQRETQTLSSGVLSAMLQWKTTSTPGKVAQSSQIAALLSTLPPLTPLADLLALYGAIGERQQQSLSDLAPKSQPFAVLGEQDARLAAADRPISSKKKRNFSLGVAGMCCNQGCTKNDIGRLC